MKKIFTLIAAAMMAVCASAQTPTAFTLETGWNCKVADATSVSLVNKAQWGAYGLSSKSVIDYNEYLGYEVKVKDVKGAFNILIESKETHEEEVSWSKEPVQVADAVVYNGFNQEKYENESYNLIKGEFKAPLIADATEKGKTISQGVGTFAIQACDGAGVDACTVESVYLVKENGSKELQYLGADAWGGGCYTATFPNPKYTYMGKWGQLYLRGAEGKTNLVVRVELDQPVQGVQICLVDQQKDAEGNDIAGYPQFDANGVAEFVVASTENVKTVGSIGIQCTVASDFPLYTVKKATFYEDTTLGINEIATKKNADVMYNIAGQRVQSAKGLVIKNGKKMIF